jgi:NAD(P)H-hydrate epimerase
MPTLPRRASDSHKGRFGSILVIAGSRGMAGAAALAGASALRSGAGLVRVASPAEVQPTVASFEPSYMTYPLPGDDEGMIAFPAAEASLSRLIAQADVVAVGPGLGQSGAIRSLVSWLIEANDRPLVLDADSLNALAADATILAALKKPVILTPHPGEFARLARAEVATVQTDRIGHAARLASRSEPLVVVLKGAGTVVTDGRRVYVNRTGNPGMATGGSGDSLTGMIAALLGQGLPAFDAAQLGVYLHGIAGDIARDQSGEVGMIAGDIVDAIPDALEYAVGDDAPEDESDPGEVRGRCGPG